jgi:hypothetical protein
MTARPHDACSRSRSKRFLLIIEDLAHRSDDDLAARLLGPFQKLALWLLRDARDPDRLLESFDTWIPTMLQLLRSPSGIELFSTLIRYMFRVVGPMKEADLRARIDRMSHDAQEAFYSYADYLEDKGRHAGRIGTLRSLLLFKFKLSSLDPAYEARLQAAPPEVIDRYLHRVLTADSLAAVFDD